MLLRPIFVRDITYGHIIIIIYNAVMQECLLYPIMLVIMTASIGVSGC